METDALETAGLRGAEVREDIAGRAAAITARRMMAICSTVDVKVFECTFGLLEIVRLVLRMLEME